ncbi:unnamed protein product [Amoebophrya sp. A25]|nr:unnamed protein product [Amoebophrya sp. A25]|eukprot:GSA25T00006923001.1
MLLLIFFIDLLFWREREYPHNQKIMVFYESCVMFNSRCSASEMQQCFRRMASIVAENRGQMLRIQDLGWRSTAYPVSKPRVGIFFHGRWFSVMFGTHPRAIQQLEEFWNHNSILLRHHTEKTDFFKGYAHRTSYYPTKDATWGYNVENWDAQGVVDERGLPKI